MTVSSPPPKNAESPMKSASIIYRTLALSLALGICFAGGCNALHLPSTASISGNPLLSGSMFPKNDQSNYVSPEGMSMSPGMPIATHSVAQLVYQGTKQAKANGGIVLQVVGDEMPVRVLPLPADGQSVYVSQLLTQSGVKKQLGAFNATLFRHSTGSIGGMPMECKMTKDGENVRPESDYALQPGDRLRVEKASLLGGADLWDLVLNR
jgi:hypothetical protein